MSAPATLIQREAAEIMPGDCARLGGRWQTVQHAERVGGAVELIAPDNTGYTFSPSALIEVTDESEE